MIRLSARLSAVASMVPANASVIDVGTDHAMVPVWLIQAGVSSRVLATDIRPGPLQRAAALLERTGTGDRIQLMQTDGLSGIQPGMYDTLILAGMGGETMISILSAAPWAQASLLLILSPQSKQAELRHFLLESGWNIMSESLVEDAGRIYPILTAKGGAGMAHSLAELHLGKLELIGGDPLLSRLLEKEIERAAKAAPFDSQAAMLLEEYISIQRRIFHVDGR